MLGKSGLEIVIAALLIGWTTDVLDGPIARKDPNWRKNLIGDSDFLIDVALVVSILCYLTFSGFVSSRLALIYFLVASLFVFRYRSQAVTMAFMAPVDAFIIYVAWRDSNLWGWAIILWIIVILLFDWHRFTQVVDNFIQGMGEILSRGRNDNTLLNTINSWLSLPGGIDYR